LCRHFPTRDALLEVAYRTEVEKLAAAKRKFAQTVPPIEALRAWMLLFVDYTVNLGFCVARDLRPRAPRLGTLRLYVAQRSG
jgi:hypothetical protein